MPDQDHCGQDKWPNDQRGNPVRDSAPEAQSVVTEEGEDVDVGKIGANDERGRGVAGPSTEAALGESGTYEGMTNVVH